MKKYEFTGETKEFFGTTLKRIWAIRSFGSVKAGDIGGWIEKEDNLSHDGEAWIFENARIFGDAQVLGNARISGYAQVLGNARVRGDAMVFGGIWDVSPCYIEGPRWSVNISSPETVRCGCQNHTWQEWHDNYKAISRLHGGDDVLEVYIRFFNRLCVMYGHEDCRIGG